MQIIKHVSCNNKVKLKFNKIFNYYGNTYNKIDWKN